LHDYFFLVGGEPVGDVVWALKLAFESSLRDELVDSLFDISVLDCRHLDEVF
jgi:hypothetical protein